MSWSTEKWYNINNDTGGVFVKKMMVLALIAALAFAAVPAAAQGGNALLVGISNADLQTPELLGEFAFGPASAITLRGKYAPDQWQVGAGWREYTNGEAIAGVFLGAYILYEDDNGARDTNMGVEVGYRYNVGRFVLDGSGRITAATQAITLNLMAGVRF